MNTHTHTYLCMRAFPSVYTFSVYVSRTQSRPFSTLVAASWTFPFDFHDTTLGAVTRALRFFLLILSFPRSRVRLLHIQRVRELYYVTDGHLSICHEEKHLSDFVHIWRTLWFDIDFSNQRDNFDKFEMYHVHFCWEKRECFKQFWMSIARIFYIQFYILYFIYAWYFTTSVILSDIQMKLCNSAVILCDNVKIVITLERRICENYAYTVAVIVFRLSSFIPMCVIWN